VESPNDTPGIEEAVLTGAEAAGLLATHRDGVSGPTLGDDPEARN